jgi:hypothetical protein
MPLADTLKRADENQRVSETIPGGLWRARTPQMFRYDCCAATQKKPTPPTNRRGRGDGVQLRRAWCGAGTNIKVTFAEGCGVAEMILQQRDWRLSQRIGQGFDARARRRARLVIGGVESRTTRARRA